MNTKKERKRNKKKKEAISTEFYRVKKEKKKKEPWLQYYRIIQLSRVSITVKELMNLRIHSNLVRHDEEENRRRTKTHAFTVRHLD